MHWAEKLIGIPYKNGGNDLNGFDCWGLFRYIENNFYGKDLSVININNDDIIKVAKEFKNNENRQDWKKVEKPKDGDAVLLCHARYPSHVGVWLDIDSGGVIHSVKGMGVIFSNLTSLKLSGWGRIEYYEYDK